MSSDLVDPKSCEYALGQIDDGNIFEHFCNQFVSQVVGHEFLPAGRIKDRGIDGLTHVFERKGFKLRLYQASIEQDPESKIEKTAQALEKNGLDYEMLTYVTNQVVKEKDRVTAEFFELHGKPLWVFDRLWIASNVNHSQGTQNAFRVFVAQHLHQYQLPGSGYVVSDLVSDPRLFVFLKQQWDASDRKDLQKVLAETLILFALEDTDPETSRFRSKSAILDDISKRISFDPASLRQTIDDRLAALSSKPRRIHHHPKEDGYCLPYETRCQIQERNLADAGLQAAFREHSTRTLKKHLDTVRVQDSVGLLEEVLHRLFYQQGLEFSSFVLNGDNQEAIEKNLAEIIAAVVAEKNVTPANRDSVTSALQIAIRDMVYNGTPEQKTFLAKLANTYMMLFLLKVDPKISAYFGKMASELRIYVDNSIIIPALSEYFLADENRRHWNLLVRAKAAGVTLIVEDRIIEELVSHLRMITATYKAQFAEAEETYLEDELMTLYIDEIMIRAYFYSKRRGHVKSFGAFIDQFVDPQIGPTAKDQLVTWLKETFGIQFIGSAKLGTDVPKDDFDRLFEELSKHKSHAAKARTDALLMLTIYHERTKRRESAEGGMLGYRTWWLSKDTSTQKAAKEALAGRFPASCYIRPDFLHNYICMSPTVQEVKDAYKTIFPSLVGVNISFHLPPDVIKLVQARIKDHSLKNKGRLTAVLADLTNRLKSDAGFRTRDQVKHFLDEKLADSKPSKRSG